MKQNFKRTAILYPIAIAAVVFSAAFLFSFPGRVQAADINWSIDPGSTASGSCSPPSTCAGSPNNVRDDNTTTAFQSGCAAVGGGTCSWTMSDIVTFPLSVSINSVELIHLGSTAGCFAGMNAQVFLNIGGVWTLIGNFPRTSFTANPTDSIINGSWSNVSGVMVGASGSAHSLFSPPECSGAASFYTNYELRAFGPSFDYSLSNSGSITVAQGGSNSNTITSTLTSGATQSVTLSASGLPAGATASFTNNPCGPTCSSTLTISTALTTPVGSYPITITGTSPARTTSFTLNVASAPSSNVSGWAWSDMPDGSDEIKIPGGGQVGRGAGWISFNCTNESVCAASNYGVNVDGSGNVTGRAWSENIGWISFNPADVAGCPSDPPAVPCAPKRDNTNGQITGWARALAYNDAQSGGWDGWIHLRGFAQNNSEYGVSAGLISGTSCSWDGWAWGSDVVGWIHFKGSGYGVLGTGNACQASGLFTAACSASPSGIVVDTTPITWFASVINGTPPYSYSWSGDDGLSGTGSSVLKSYLLPKGAPPQEKNAVASITDSTGASTSGACSVTIRNPECSDGIDNDGDHLIDFGTAPTNDNGCTSLDDDSEGSLPPIKIIEVRPSG